MHASNANMPLQMEKCAVKIEIYRQCICLNALTIIIATQAISWAKKGKNFGEPIKSNAQG